VKTSLLALTSLLFLQPVVAAAQTDLDSVSINRLYYAGKIWGYVKYFHSEVARGMYNWDNVLIQTVRKVKASKNDGEFNIALKEMIGAAGEMADPNSPQPIIADSLKYNLDLRWLHDATLSSDVRSALDTITDKFRPQSHYLVGEAFSGGNPTFTKDSTYYNTSVVPEQEVRLLALFRYWNIINYFAPNKYRIDKNWDTTLKEFIPRLWNATESYAYYRSMLELTTRINDSHASTYSSYIGAQIRGGYVLPIKLRYINGETVVVGVLDGTSDVRPGDIIKKIQGIDIGIVRDSVRQYTPASNPTSLERDVNWSIVRGMRQEGVRLLVEGKSGQREVVLARGTNSLIYNGLYPPTGPIWKRIRPLGTLNVFGYVDMGRLTLSDVATMFADLWDTDAIIFDCRNYPKNTLWEIVRYLYSTPLFNAKFTVPDIRYPGTLTWQSSYIGVNNVAKPYQKELRILFDEDTQSQAEYTVMGLEVHRPSLKIGSQTAGADGNVSLIYLPGGVSTYFSGLGVYYPDGRKTQRIGIVPDVEVHPTIGGIRDGRDEVLEIALGDSIQKYVITSDQPTVMQNYPNPFNSSTRIFYAIPASGFVKLKVYDVLGREVKTLMAGNLSRGTYSADFDDTGISSGVYFATFEVNGKLVEVKKMVCIR
jgi:carboxyl-terminal processing protease